MQTRNLSITIAVPLKHAYEQAHHPAFFKKWAAGMSSTANVEFTPRNDFGVLDHRVHIEGKPEIYVPLRMIANGEGTEVVLTLFREPHMSDADFAKDQGLVEKDLAALKKLLETR